MLGPPHPLRADGRETHLDEAVDAGRGAVGSVPDGHPQRPTHLSNLALALRRRFLSTGRRADADEAVACLRQAVRAHPHDHPARAACLANLSIALLARFQRPGQHVGPDDAAEVDEAVDAAREAVRATPEGDPRRSQYLSNLAVALLVRVPLSRSRADLRAVRKTFRQATGVATAPPLARFRAARTWAKVTASLGRWPEALDAYRSAVAELPLLAWHGLDRTDRLDALGRAAGLAGDAAAVALNARRPEEALQLLEQGRGVLLAQALDARDDMTALEERAPALAARIREIRALLNTDPTDLADPTALSTLSAPETGPADQAGEQRAAAERRRELAREMDDLVRRARELPGLADFLRPPSVARLREAAANGPVVVVNTSALRCDALVLTRDRLRTVPLPDLRLEGRAG
ncbi:hypothetical protein ACFQ2B_32945 [Streptomyces stramineus]